MQILWKRLSFMAVLLMVTMGSVAALGNSSQTYEQTITQSSDSVNVRVIPAEGVQGSTHTIFVSGLSEREAVTIRIIRDENSANVYETSRTADGNGRIELDIFTTDEDAPGLYLVEVLNQDNDIIGSSELTILEPEGRDGSVLIIPDKAEAGATFVIEVRDVRPFTDMDIFVFNEDGDEVFDTVARTNVDGFVSVEFESETADGGTYSVVVEDDDVSVAGDIFTIDGPIFTVSTSVMPNPVIVDEDIVISIVGLDANQTYTMTLLRLNEIVQEREITADANGSALVIISAEMPGGYTLQVLEGDQLVSQTAYLVEGTAEAAQTANGQGVTVVIAPEVGTTDDTYVVSVSGLESNETAQLAFAVDGETQITQDITADVNGTALATINDLNVVGTYSVELLRDETALASASFVVDSVAADSGVTVTIDPTQGDIGTLHEVMISGLEAEETVGIDVLYDGEVVFNTERTADADGMAVVYLRSETGDDSGTYTVQINREQTTLASADFIVGDNVTVEIVPQSGEIGTTHAVSITGLNAEETVNLNVYYNDETVYSTQATADMNGTALVNLISEEGDSEGAYTVEVMRGGEIIAADDFIIGDETVVQQQPDEDEQAASEVTVVVEPDSGERGTQHVVTVSGLEPRESIILDLFYDGENVFTTELTASQAGVASIILTSEATDPFGDYDVQVSRGADMVAEATLTITEAQDAPPPAEDITVTVEPTTGEVDEAFSVLVEGLAADETVEIIVSYDDEVVFSTERTADSAGIAELLLAAEEGDPAGDYVITVERAGEVVGEGVYVLQGDVPPADDEDEDEDTVVGGGTGGRVITDSLNFGEPSDRITFEGEEGDSVLISLNSQDFDTYLVLEDDAGNELTFNDDSNGTLNSQIGPYTLPYTGEYVIVASSYSFTVFGEPAVGDYRLTIENIGLTEVAYGDTTTIDITAENFSQFLTFFGDAGDVIAIDVESNGSIDTELSIINPNGVTDFSDDDGGEGYDPEVVRYVLPVTGEYTVTIRAFTPGEEGRVDVTITREDERTLDEETRVVTLNRKFNSDILTFEGEAGEAIQLDMFLLGGNVGDLNISVTQNDTNLMFYQTFGLPSEVTLGFVVPDDGTVTIRVEDFSDSTSQLQISIEREPAD